MEFMNQQTTTQCKHSSDHRLVKQQHGDKKKNTSDVSSRLQGMFDYQRISGKFW